MKDRRSDGWAFWISLAVEIVLAWIPATVREGGCRLRSPEEEETQDSNGVGDLELSAIICIGGFFACRGSHFT
jgi:hypothetical protein